jgi:Raf kinase inhibitor-like YbhB/YbcL family protein
VRERKAIGFRMFWTSAAKRLLLRFPPIFIQEEDSMRDVKGLIFVAALLSLSAVTAFAQQPRRMALTSTSFQDGAVIPDKYTQASSSPVSPELTWTNVPEGTQSFALIVDDPDTALRRTTNEVLHWAAFNIPANKTSLPEGVPNQATLPDGTIQPLNTGKKPGFMGPGAGCCVYHHYTFQLYALDTKLNLGPDATRAQIMNAMDGHVLGKAVLVGRFHRPQQ